MIHNNQPAYLYFFIFKISTDINIHIVGHYLRIAFLWNSNYFMTFEIIFDIV